MLYAQFYQRAAWPIGSEKLVEAIGDRAVVILDARFAIFTNMGIAARECRSRGYAAYALFRSENFNRSSTQVTVITEVR
jgi:hypothetical protein